MITKPVTRSFVPLLLIFIIINALLLSGRSVVSRLHMEVDVVIIGNLLLFVATGISFYLYTRSLYTKNPHAIVRTMYGSLLAKMMICLIAVFIYISIAGKAVNRNAVLGCMFLYVLYTFIEVRVLMKLSKQNKNV